MHDIRVHGTAQDSEVAGSDRGSAGDWPIHCRTAPATESLGADAQRSGGGGGWLERAVVGDDLALRQGFEQLGHARGRHFSVLLRFVSLQVLSGCVSYSRWFALIILVWGRERTVRDDPSAG